MQTLGEQLELELFSPPSFDFLLLKNKVTNLSIEFNKRLKKGWSVKIGSFSGKRTLTLPEYFGAAPEPVKEALVEWALMPLSRRSKKASLTQQRKKQLERFIWEYVEKSGNRTDRVKSADPATFITKGKVYDLQEVFSSVNAAYFNSTLSSFIRWNKSNWRSYQTFFVDKNKARHNLISIAQLYNKAGVPRFAIEGIMYHEMLHIAIPPYKRNNKNIIHGREFKKAEREFPFFNDWRRWEKDHLKSIRWW